jgi:hypothetical protein
MNLGEIRCGGVDWIKLPQEWQSFVNMLTYHLVL